MYAKTFYLSLIVGNAGMLAIEREFLAEGNLVQALSVSGAALWVNLGLGILGFILLCFDNT